MVSWLTQFSRKLLMKIFASIHESRVSQGFLHVCVNFRSLILITEKKTTPSSWKVSSCKTSVGVVEKSVKMDLVLMRRSCDGTKFFIFLHKTIPSDPLLSVFILLHVIKGWDGCASGISIGNRCSHIFGNARKSMNLDKVQLKKLGR